MVRWDWERLAEMPVRAASGLKNGVRALLRREEPDPAEAEDAGEACAPAEEPGLEENPSAALYARLREVPGPAELPAEAGFAFCRAQDEGRGEDSCLAIADGNRAFLGVFDGCGGSGARVYPAFGGHTGAWAASRAATLAARRWFDEGPDAPPLEECLAGALAACRACHPGGQLLMGSLSREFPTTLAAFVDTAGEEEVEVWWCGDSRCYALDEEGLHQLTEDDASIRDAMRNLREDAPMTNVLCASAPFELHRRRVALPGSCVVLAATDGCFGYLPSPMAFEAMLLETLQRAKDPLDWQRRLEARIRAVAGDDYTMAAWIRGFDSFRQLKQALRGRLAALKKQYPPSETSEEALFRQWEAYRGDYERLLPGDGADPGRSGA